MLTIISTDKAPKAVGPYSQAVKTPSFIFCSGQIPIDPASGQLIQGSVREQAHQVMTNLNHVLKSAGSELSKVVKTTVFLKDMKDFDEVNAVYAEFFPGEKPARSCVAVSTLPKNATLEIEAIAMV